MKLKLYTSLKRLGYLIIVAWMLGVSNIILEETRMVHETRAAINQQEEIFDTNLDEEENYNFS